MRSSGWVRTFSLPTMPPRSSRTFSARGMIVFGDNTQSNLCPIDGLGNVDARQNSGLTASGYFWEAPVLKIRIRSVDFDVTAFQQDFERAETNGRLREARCLPQSDEPHPFGNVTPPGCRWPRRR